ncbi:hypothetical protein HQQ81_21230 [Microbacteriaceae bacterium VKM Ac-2854]|nr:hypothetical protein [Microbacteriaceae bacterium VKM Ac-2854]
MNDIIPASGPRRRTLVKGAAWTVPAVAVAVAAPMASASPSTNPWNVSIVSDCVLDAGGTGLIAPGFRVHADSPSEPIPSQLVVTETATGTWSLNLPAPFGIDATNNLAFEAAFDAFSLAYATAIVAAVLTPAALAVSGPKVAGDFWISPTSLGDYLSPPTVTRVINGSGLAATVTISVTWDIQRELTLNGLVPGDDTFWGYFGALVPPDVTGVPGFALINSIATAIPVISSAWTSAIGALSPKLALTAAGQWSDAQPDHTAALTNLFAFSCN